MKKSYVYLINLFLIFIYFPFTTAQNPSIDSLQTILKHKVADTVRINVLNELCWELGGIDPEKAIEFGEQALELANECNFKKGIAKSYSNIGVVYDNKGKYNNAQNYYLKALEIYKEINDKQGEASIYNNLGIIYFYQRNFDKTLEYWFKSINIFEELGNKEGIATLYNNIGIIHFKQSNYLKAKDYYIKALELRKVIGNKQAIATSYFNIGNIYYEIGNELKEKSYYDTALYFHFESLNIKKELGNKKGIAGSYNNIGTIYDILGMVNKTLEYYMKSLEIYESLGYKQGIAESLKNIGQVYYKTGKIQEAIKYIEKSLYIAKEIGSWDDIKTAYQSLSEAYLKIHNYQKAFKYQKFYAELQDTILKRESNERFAKMQTRYETEKKDKENELLKKENEINNTKLARKNIIIYSVIGGFVLVLALVFLIYNRYKIKKKANEQLALHNEKIQAQSDEVEKQRNIAVIQRDRIKEQKQNITDSIHYAQRIQRAILPPQNIINKVLPEHFIFYKPKDIVSGDYYWLTQRDDKIILAAADSTGHGVPGAFMSMLGVAFLNEIVNKSEKLQANLILNRLRENVINSLHQTGKEGESKDGIDIALIIIDNKTLELQYAGAYNPLYIVRPIISDSNYSDNQTGKKDDFLNSHLKYSDDKYKFFEIKADRMPIGFHPKAYKDFTNHIINLCKGDTVYIFTDGYADQFGGKSGKKFYYAPFRKLLLDIQDKPMIKQYEILEKTINNWKGDLEQIDDLLVVGVKFN